VSASTVQKQVARLAKPGRSVYFCSACDPHRVPMADDHVHQAQCRRARSANGGAFQSVEPSSTTMISTGPQSLSVQRRDRGVNKPGAAVESRYNHADQSVAGGPRLFVASRRTRLEKTKRKTCSEECRISRTEKASRNKTGSGKQMHHFEHTGYPPAAAAPGLTDIRRHRASQQNDWTGNESAFLRGSQVISTVGRSRAVEPRLPSTDMSPTT